MPKLLGRNAVELGIAEMISIVHDSSNVDKLAEILGSKDFLTGQNPTFIDFFAYESFKASKLDESNDRVRAYLERIENLTSEKPKSLSNKSGLTKML